MKLIHKITFVFILIGVQKQAQTPISLEEAYQIALDNNLDIKTSKLRADFQNKIQKSSKIVDPLSLSFEVGQINSNLIDNTFSIAQTFRLPNFYKKQNKILTEEWKNSLISVNMQKWELKRDLSLIFNLLHYLDKKKNLLEKINNIYTQYFDRIELRLSKGETNTLEKSLAENLKSQINIQLFNVKNDKENAIQQLNLLINGTKQYTNTNEPYHIQKLNFSEQNLNNHWIIQKLELQKNIEQTKLFAEKAKLQPSFSLSYNNLNMKKDYASTRLHNGAIGLNIPVFNTGQKAVIEGQKVNQLIAENNIKIGLNELKKQHHELEINYKKLNVEINYYQEKGLETSEQIIKTADQQLHKGEINFIEWSILINQALDIQNQYIDKSKELNDIIIKLNSLFIPH